VSSDERPATTERPDTADELDSLVEDTHPPVPATVRTGSPAESALTAAVNEQTPALGLRVVRADGRTHITGATRYADDLTMPGMLHAAFLRSAHAHARIRSIDVSEAAQMPGVIATLTGAEVPVNSFGSTYQDQPVLAVDRVRHHGDLVAAVAGETEQQARDALAKIRVDYEPLPAVFDPFEAMSDGAPRLHGPSNVYTSKAISRGDVERGFAESARIFEGRFSTQMIEHAPMEPYAAIARWEPGGRVHLTTTLGRITLARTDIARTLAIPVGRVRVTASILGGNFGGKNEIRTEPALALLSAKTGRPVKGVYTREEEFTSSTVRHPLIADYKTGVTADGRLIARKVRLVLDGGAYASWSETTVGKAAILATGPYRIPHLLVEGCAVYTNKTVAGAMRGFGAPQVCFAYESQMDEIAHALGIDPLEIRLRNAFTEGSVSPTGQVLEAVGLSETLHAAARRAGWPGAGT
jgi:CO/xanthine dehydrogenase Mo-binding subunit